MKVLLPVDEDKKDICVSFGRTPYFMIYDTDSKQKEFIVNEAASAQGGAGIKAAQTVIDSGATAVITVRLGENSAEVLKAGEVGIFKAKGADVDENIELFLDKKLNKLTQFHAGFHGRSN